jgi:hypothetical protein
LVRELASNASASHQREHLKRVDSVIERPIDFRAKEAVMRLTGVAGLLTVLLTVLLLWGCAGLATSPPDAPTQIMPLRAGAKAVAPVSVQAPRPSAPPSKQDTTPPGAAMPKAPPLNLASLEQRLKEIKAIGILTKITLKNQVGDLLDQFRSFYQGTLKTDLADLRRSYDLLVLKVLSLLQDSDHRLATAIAASREAIWGILSDPVKFSKV